MNGGIRRALRLMLVAAAPLALAGCVLEALLFVRAGDVGTFTGDTLISACSSTSSPGGGGPTVTCQIGPPGNLITTSFVAGGGGSFAISPWDPIILEVPAAAGSIGGTFSYTLPGLPPSPLIPLVVTAGLSSLAIDAKTTLVAEPGTQLVVVDVPSELALPNEINYTLHYSDPTQLRVKAMFAVKVRSGPSTYYAPVLPCATNFAGLPGVPSSGNLTMPQILAFVTSMTPCANKAYDFSPGTSPPPPSGPNYQGIWWESPANSESGWGLNLAHQGDTIFASWFTYDTAGRDWWLTMTANKTGAGTYSGKLFTTRGPAFNAVPWDPATVNPTQVGSGTITFADANNGTFSYTIGAVSQAKAITRQVFGPLPTCTYQGGSLVLATNYTDLWWAKPAASESGWGINLNHQGDTIFATWFTYDLDHLPLWLVVTAHKQSAGVYAGDLYQTSGARFDAFNPTMVTANKVGTATFTFADGNNASFQYTVQLPSMGAPVTQAKSITRELFTAFGTTCR
jgi:hypothetical protein